MHRPVHLRLHEGRRRPGGEGVKARKAQRRRAPHMRNPTEVLLRVPFWSCPPLHKIVVADRSGPDQTGFRRMDMRCLLLIANKRHEPSQILRDHHESGFSWTVSTRRPRQDVRDTFGFSNQRFGRFAKEFAEFLLLSCFVGDLENAHYHGVPSYWSGCRLQGLSFANHLTSRGKCRSGV